MYLFFHAISVYVLFFLMYRAPPRVTLTDPRFPCATLCRSRLAHRTRFAAAAHLAALLVLHALLEAALRHVLVDLRAAHLAAAAHHVHGRLLAALRSDERRVGKELVSSCRSRLQRYHRKKNSPQQTLHSTDPNQTKPPT